MSESSYLPCHHSIVLGAMLIQAREVRRGPHYTHEPVADRATHLGIVATALSLLRPRLTGSPRPRSRHGPDLTPLDRFSIIKMLVVWGRFLGGRLLEPPSAAPLALRSIPSSCPQHPAPPRIHCIHHMPLWAVSRLAQATASYSLEHIVLTTCFINDI